MGTGGRRQELDPNFATHWPRWSVKLGNRITYFFRVPGNVGFNETCIFWNNA